MTLWENFSSDVPLNDPFREYMESYQNDGGLFTTETIEDFVPLLTYMLKSREYVWIYAVVRLDNAFNDYEPLLEYGSGDKSEPFRTAITEALENMGYYSETTEPETDETDDECSGDCDDAGSGGPSSGSGSQGGHCPDGMCNGNETSQNETSDIADNCTGCRIGETIIGLPVFRDSGQQTYYSILYLPNLLWVIWMQYVY